jgi:predicted PurR-regulated permease PerM
VSVDLVSKVWSMIENESLGITTLFEVVVGPLVLAMALAYGLYRYRHGSVATTRENTPKGMFVTGVVLLAAFCVIIIAGSIVITRSINNSAETTGSSTRPADPGAPMDQVNREQSPGKRTNAP